MTSCYSHKSAILISILLIGVTTGFTAPQQPIRLNSASATISTSTGMPITHTSHSPRQPQRAAAAMSPLFSSVSASIMQATTTPEQQEEHPHKKERKLGPLKTLRATMRAATGLSLTAMYLSVVGFTSWIVRETMAVLLSILPTGVRYFLQPFLILYYVPLYMLRNWTSPKKRRERSDLYAVMKDDFKQGLQAADAAQEAGYWPIQMNDNKWKISPPPLVDDNNDDNEDDGATSSTTE